VTEEDGERLAFSEKDIGRTMTEVKSEQKAKEAEDECTVTREEVDEDDMLVFYNRRPSTDMAPPKSEKSSKSGSSKSGSGRRI
jgi:hypothetical protein